MFEWLKNLATDDLAVICLAVLGLGAVGVVIFSDNSDWALAMACVTAIAGIAKPKSNGNEGGDQS